jgi:hypothetical protein
VHVNASWRTSSARWAGRWRTIRAHDHDDEASVAFVDPAALEAAVLNVALNARDAMLEGR